MISSLSYQHSGSLIVRIEVAGQGADMHEAFGRNLLTLAEHPETLDARNEGVHLLADFVFQKSQQANSF